MSEDITLFFFSVIGYNLVAEHLLGVIQPVLHDWCNKGSDMCHSLSRMVHIKEPLLLIGKSSPCGGVSVFPFSLPEWSFTICLTPYNHK